MRGEAAAPSVFSCAALSCAARPFSRWRCRSASRTRVSVSPGSSTTIVGRDAERLDRAPAGRVVARGGELDRGVVAQRHDGLHRALAEGLRAHHLGALVVLQRAGDDLRGRGRAAVHQHHHRHGLRRRRQGLAARRRRGARSPRGWRRTSCARPRRGRRSTPPATSAAGTPTRSPPRRAAGRPDRCAGRAPGPSPGPCLNRPVEVLHQVLGGRFLELRDAHPGEAGLDHLRLDALHADHRARDA